MRHDKIKIREVTTMKIYWCHHSGYNEMGKETDNNEED